MGVEAFGIVNLGTTTLNTAGTPRVAWEPELDRFGFERGTGTKRYVI